jgi:hypothetical protein
MVEALRRLLVYNVLAYNLYYVKLVLRTNALLCLYFFAHASLIVLRCEMPVRFVCGSILINHLEG